jgi:hypothetical protein
MNFKERIFKLLNYKNLAALLALGIILMIFGGGDKAEVKTGYDKPETTPPFDEDRLCDILESIEGAGRVRVFISYSDNGSEEVLYDVQSSSDGEKHNMTLNVKNDDNPYVIKRKPPEIKGILVTASGAVNSSVKKRLKESVRCATGVPPGKIHIECSERQE